MPTVIVNVEDVDALLGTKISLEKLEYVLPLIKCEVKAIEGNEITLETNADRVDMLSSEGVVRALRHFLDIGKGYSGYKTTLSGITVKVDASVKGVRPFIACAVLRNVALTDEFLRQLLQLQEKLHDTLCRRRRKGSIGIYDLEKVESPFRYSAVKPSEIRFTPLECKARMTGVEILEKTDKGREYAHIISNFDRYPLLSDSKGTVLSMPPIINSEETRVTPKSKNLFVDVTGLNDSLVNDAVNIIASNVAERGTRIESVKVQYPNRTVETGRLKAKSASLSLEFCREVSGIDFTLKTLHQSLRRTGYGVKETGRNKLSLSIPPYRADIIHSVDLVEDAIIGYGYDKIEHALPRTLTRGKELAKSKLMRKIRDLMIGFGFQEILSYIMTDRESQTSKVNLTNTKLIEIANPLTSEFAVFRHSLLPGLIRFLSANAHVDYPQRIFECGHVIYEKLETETSTNAELRVAGAICDAKVSYESAQSVVYSFLRNMALKTWRVLPTVHPTFIDGRVAKLIGDDGESGIIGEIHPEVLNRFKIPNPAVAFEINVDGLFRFALTQ